ncbi:MAG: prepilin-type N-terminal cleavage/methylation domain-containing protein [Planctomycetia bacterium]|nr:prepilin-type N-terminal cleavage/methylation domain-containing protein [Planctomycetia bacterium]
MKRSTINRKGMTLIELLVVATIILMVTAISVPVLKPMMQSQATSNAAAVVSTYLNRARARAIQTGRPCGVMFEVWDGTNLDMNTGDPVAGASLVLRQVEVPPAYTGMTGAEMVSIPYSDPSVPIMREDPDNPDINLYSIASNDIYWDVLVQNQTSARIQFDNMGPFYQLSKNTVQNSGQTITYSEIREIPGIQVPRKRDGVPFKVLRDPKPTMTAPVGLPQGTVVDLDWSGTDKNTVQVSMEPMEPTKVQIMFLPNGSVDSISGLGLLNNIPDSTIYLMIGRWERIPALGIPEDGLRNYQDGSNFWVTINPQNGMVSTVEVNTDIDPNSSDPVLYQSRNFARQSQRNIGAY